MMIKKSERIMYKNSDKCIAYEYPFENKELNVAYIEINGRYPDKGRVVNEKCTELVHVISGKGKIVIEGKEYELEEGNQVLVLPKNKYYFDSCANLKIITPCAPAWYPEQHKECD